jgi:hypothetical protein
LGNGREREWSVAPFLVYHKLRQTISIVITDHTLFRNEMTSLNCYELRNRESGALFTDLQQYVILELNKPPGEETGGRCGRI